MTESQSQSEIRVILENGNEYATTSREQLIEWRREGRIPDSARIVFNSGECTSVSDIGWLSSIENRSVPPTRQEDMRPVDNEPGALDSLIPAKNSSALTAYYLGVFSLIPLFGAAFGIAAIILGIIGIKNSRKPEVGVGYWHGVVAVVLGTVCSIVWSLLIVGAIYMKITMS